MTTPSIETPLDGISLALANLGLQKGPRRPMTTSPVDFIALSQLAIPVMGRRRSTEAQREAIRLPLPLRGSD